jgi:hypothetical protein
MLRRQIRKTTAFPVSSLSNQFRFNSTKGPNRKEEVVSAEELAHRAKIEAIARQRLFGEGNEKITGFRSREFGAPADTKNPPPIIESDLPLPPNLQEPKSSSLKVERHRDTSRQPSAAGSGAPINNISESISAAAAARIAEIQKNHPVPPKPSSSSSSSNTNQKEDQQQQVQTSSKPPKEQEQQQQQQQQNPVAGSPMSAQGGTTIVFDVPEGDLPQQATYDPWAILGLKPGASNHDLRVRYHELLERYHPEYVRDGSGGDVQKWAEVDRAYQLVTKAPSHDKRYRNLLTNSQHFYYRFLPMWMARNIDEMPRWWSWMRFKLPSFWFFTACLGAIYVVGKVYAYHPGLGTASMLCFVMDVLIHTTAFPVSIGIILATLLFSGGNKDLAWITSPKGLLRRFLTY